MTSPRAKQQSPVSLAGILSAYKGLLFTIAWISGVVNVLALTGSFFMLQVYDRVIPSGSLPTLLGLVIVVTVLFVFYGLLEYLRSVMLIRFGWSADRRLSAPVYDAAMRLPLKTGQQNDGMQSLRDLDQVRAFMSGMGPSAFFDLPWMPFYILICFFFHVWIGVFALVSATLLVFLALVTDVRSRKPVEEANEKASQRSQLAQAAKQNFEVLWAMGFHNRMAERWLAANEAFLEAQARASDTSGGLGSITKIIRLGAQSGILAVGAILVVNQQATGGIIIASSILLSRSLAPVELAISQWKGFVSARQGWHRLVRLMDVMRDAPPTVKLPAPAKTLSVSGLTVAAPGGARAIVMDATFQLQAGDGLGIIGPSGSGKSTLLRALTGVWTPARGEVRLDGATLNQWDAAELGRHIGFLPQQVSLFSGTIAENIARFDPDAKSEDILKAAQAAGCHQMIVQMPDGFDTPIGEQGGILSAGQRQRIGLARALYGDPFLVVLDEPNSNLDAEGELALNEAILSVRRRGGIAIVVAHRPSALAPLDKVMMVAAGRIQAFGPRDEVLQKVTAPLPPQPQPPTSPQRPVRLVTDKE
ncbi:type I secretion system permease/ATPase [Ciceribacter sp. L1K23]|uniref:type I secretion system permease/ATPase n=1 Tax=Ciceribacter sp. L1K23 TaxID=2820276 RepID=UPI001B818E00|nr:type I secretion system permease/ATPase [Ciceribacter sp. L1K23]MBR0555782.1 type I secretion system permease/ATPase [Ciceribacter sp. L1K23]